MPFNKNQPNQHGATRLLAIITLAILFFSSVGTKAAAAGIQKDAQQTSNPCIPQGVKSTTNAARHTINFVGTDPGQAIAQPAALSANASPEAAARGYLSVCGAYFGLQDQAAELTVISQNSEGNGARSFVHFQQVTQGIPVLAGEMIVQVDQARNIVATTSKLSGGAKVNTQPTLDATAAKKQALISVAKKYQLNVEDLAASVPALWIYDPSLIGPQKNPRVIVWRVEVTTVNNASLQETVLVDAQAGSIVLSVNQLNANGGTGTGTTAVKPQGINPGNPSPATVLGAPLIYVYTMKHSTNASLLPGVLVCTQRNPTDCNSDPDAQKAYQYALDTYNFYDTNFSRNNISNLGGPAILVIHYGTNVQDGTWNGNMMFFGDGNTNAEDLVGHEFTQGVIGYQSKLINYYQAGSIASSLGDVFGEFVEKSNQGDVDWQIAEDAANGTLHDMADPTIHTQPDKMSSPNYYRFDGGHGGVYLNSGINNKAAYLMTAGGSFNGYDITGLGMTKVAHIYYEAMNNLLVSGSDYFDLYTALYQGCLNLVGTYGITDADCTQEQNATLAVEMDTQPFPGFNPNAPLCPTGGAVLTTLLDDGFESGLSANFTTGTLVGANPWHLLTGNVLAHTGDNSAAVNDISSISESYISTKNIAIPGGAFLHFDQLFDFDGSDTDAYDGGVIEYSTDGGVTWNDAGSMINTIYGKNYDKVISTRYRNPLAGRLAFTNGTNGFVETVLDLTSLAGQNAMFRWVLGTDSSLSGIQPWVLDDIRIYTCQITINTSINGTIQGTYYLNPNQAVKDSYAGLNNGPVEVDDGKSSNIIASERVGYTPDGGTTWTSYSELMGLPAGQVTSSYVMPWYNNVDLNTQLRFGNVGNSTTNVTITIAGVIKGTYPIAPSQSIRISYPGLDNGPVQVQSSGGVPIIASERVAYYNGSAWTSFSELMGLPTGQLTTSYVLPWYNNVDLDTQLRFGNVGSSSTVVTVTIGGVEKGTYPLVPSQSVRVNYPSLDNGPVVITSSGGVPIIASERVAYTPDSGTTWPSFSELMGLPSGEVTTSYVMPLYDNVTLNTQLRFGNVGSTSTDVTVTIGGLVQGTYTLAPSQSARISFTGLNDGPVKIQSSGGVPIIASQRVAYYNGSVWTSFAEMMGLPNTQLTTAYVMPWYNNVDLDTQLRFAVP